MSNYLKAKPQKYEYVEDPEGKRRNNQLKKQNEVKEKWWKRKLGFFTSTERYTKKELVVNWLIVFWPIIFFIVVMVVPPAVGYDVTSNTLSAADVEDALGLLVGIGFFSFVTLIGIGIMIVLKQRWRAKRRKATYWPEKKKVKILSKEMYKGGINGGY